MLLHDFELSGNCYKVRLFLNLLQLPHDILAVDLVNGAHKQPSFLELNPKGQVPVLQDGGWRIADSQAILVYLAKKYAPVEWYPQDPETAGEIQFWLATAANEIARGPADARLVKLFRAKIDYEAAASKAHAVLTVLEQHLKERLFLVGSRVTIADLAVFPYVALAGDGDIDLGGYPAIDTWIERIKALSGFIGMPGITAPATA